MDGWITKPNTPLVTVRLEKATHIEVNGHTYKRQRIDVLMDFTSPDGCTELSNRLRKGHEGVNPTHSRTYIYSSNARGMCHYLELKHAQTAGEVDVPVPPLLNVYSPSLVTVH
jgi:hypothetical protein